MVKCCKDCKDRHPKCHADCKPYLSAASDIKKANDKRREQQRIDAALFERNKRAKRRWVKNHK